LLLAGQGWLSYYKDSIPAALADLFPNFPWKRWKFAFVSVPKNFWFTPRHRREFLEDLIQANDVTSIYSLPKAAYDTAGGMLLSMLATSKL